jgi:putative redox protein
VILTHLTLEGDLTEEQRQRLREIGDRCPVHRLLSAGTEIRTLLPPTAPPLVEITP